MEVEVALQAASSASAEQVGAAAEEPPFGAVEAAAPSSEAAAEVHSCAAAGPVARTGAVAEAMAAPSAESAAVEPFGGVARLVGMKARGTMGAARIQSRAGVAPRALAPSKAGCSR